MSTARAYSYLRFSTPEQERGDSRRRQTALADEYAKRHGLILDDQLRMEDRGVSGFSGANLEDTAALGAFLAAVKAGDVPRGSVLLVENLDRMGRQPARKALRVLEDIIESGVDVVTLGNGMRWTLEKLDGYELLIAIVDMTRAHGESKRKSELMSATNAGKRAGTAANGYGKHRNVLTEHTVGWVDVAADGTRTLNADKAAVVRRIFEAFIAGTGQHAIAETLNRENVPRFGRATQWHRSYVNKMLRNPAVLGTIQTKDRTIENYYPAVIDRETWERAQALVETNHKAPGALKSTLPVQNILAGLAKCPHCSGAMTRIYKGRRGGVPKLVCSHANMGGACQYVLVSLPAIESALQRTAQDPLPERDAALGEELKSRRGELEGIEHTIEMLVAQIERSPSKALTERLKAREAELESLTLELAALEKRAGDSDSKVYKRRVERYRAAMTAKPFNVAAANVALREMVTKVVVDYNRQALRMFWRHDGESEIVYAV